jgi:hypothetical protein
MDRIQQFVHNGLKNQLNHRVICELFLHGFVDVVKTISGSYKKLKTVTPHYKYRQNIRNIPQTIKTNKHTNESFSFASSFTIDKSAALKLEIN